MTFLNQPLLWGLGLMAVPVLIHLINMLRHRRVKWAAMEFLLASQKKHSTWIRLKELLLLLLRVAAVAAIVLIVARPRLDGGLGKRLGDVTTHHVVLLDDSFSMSDRFAERNVFDAAKESVVQIAEQALNESSAQTFTLLRASRALTPGAAQPDLFGETVNSELVLHNRDDRKLNGLLASFEPTDLAAGPEALIRSATALLKPNEAEERIVYIVSDFRAKDWRENEELQNRLVALERKAAQVYFLNVTDAERPNLAVTSLKPASGTVAAGVHFFMQAEVRNFGRGQIENVPLSIRLDRDSGGVVFVPKIEPGATDVVRFPVFFSSAGSHAVSVALEPDAVAADNQRFTVLDVPAELPVLIIDGAGGDTGRRVAEALSPPGPVRSGLAPNIQAPAFMNDPEANPLLDFHTAFLCNIERLDEAAVRNLEAFVEAGGGVCFIVGDKTNVGFFNEQLYRGGAGPFPVPLDAEKPLFRPVDGARAADIVGSSHPVFKLFTLEQNTYLYDVTVNKYFGVRPDWTPEEGAKSQTDVIARFRNGAPLAVEKTFGKGRVAALLALPVAPHSDWARNGSFVVTILEMQSHLTSRDNAGVDERRVGTPLVLEGDPQEFRPAAQLLPPLSSNNAAVSLQAVAGPNGLLRWEFPDTTGAGFYRVERTKLDDTVTVALMPMNVDPAEGDLTRFEEADLRERLPGSRFIYRASGGTKLTESDSRSSNLSMLLVYALAAVLLGEQALAYFASYHPSPKGAGA